MTRVNIELNKR